MWPMMLLAGVSELGHVSAPGLALVPLPVGLLAALALATLGTRPIHRWGVPAAALGGLWVAASWWFGLDQPVVLVVGAALAVPTVIVWWRYQHPRSRIEVLGGSPWPWHGLPHRFHREARRDLGNVAQVWDYIADVVGVPGAHLRRVIADIDDGYELHVDLPRGKLGKHIKPDVLASALREFPVDIVTPDPRRPWEIVLRQQLEPDDELHGDEESEAGEESGEPAPAAADPDEIGRQFVLMAIQRSGPISGRKAGEVARVQKDRAARYVKELAAAGHIVEEGGGWVVAREAS